MHTLAKNQHHNTRLIYDFLEKAAATLQNAETMHKIHVKENGLGPFCYD
jgi:hypothetical protein